MAANKPIAVAIKASAIPGATTAKVACCILPKDINEFIMPHTVPNKPTYGLVEPTVAKNARFCSRSSTSLEAATRIARCTESVTDRRMPGSVFKARLYSWKPSKKIRSKPRRSGRWAKSSYSVFKDTPFQNCSSNLFTLRCKPDNLLALDIISVHDSKDATTNILITILTTGLASMISFTIDNSVVTEVSPLSLLELLLGGIFLHPHTPL